MKFSKQYKILLLFFIFLIFSLSLSLIVIKTPTKITQKALEPTSSKIEKFNPPPVQHQYQLIAHGFHNFVGELGRNQNPEWNIYTPNFIDFVDKKICDISNGLEGEEPEICNVKNEGGVQIIRLSGAVGLVITDKEKGSCDFSGDFTYDENGKAKEAKYPNKRTDWKSWLKLIEKIKTQTNADIFISVDFPDYCVQNTANKPINENDLQYLTALVNTAITKLESYINENNERINLLEAVRYWNYGNEPGIGRLTQLSSNGEYLISIFSDEFSREVKSKCPSCKVIISGSPSYPIEDFDNQKSKTESFFQKYLRELKARNTSFDGFDIHWHHQCLNREELNYYKIGEYFNWFVNIASQALGVDPGTLKNSKETVITENSEICLESNPTSCPEGVKDICGSIIIPPYTQNYQANGLIKRILTAFASGVKKVSYTSLIEAPYGNNPCGYFSHIGLLDTYGNERLSFKALEILSEKIYGATKIEWNYNQSNSLETIKISYDNNQNPETFVLWTRNQNTNVNINPSDLFNPPLNSPPYVVLKINEQNTWQKKLLYQNSLTLDNSPTFVYKPLNCSAVNIGDFSFLNNATFKGYDENQIPIWEINNTRANLKIKVSSPERKIKILGLRKKLTSEKDICGVTNDYLVKKWISPSLVKEMEVSTDISLSPGEHYLYLVVSDDFRGCSGDLAANSSNGFCTAGLGKLNNAVIKVLVSEKTNPNELSPTPTITPTSTPILEPSPTSIPTPTPTPTSTPSPTPTFTPTPAPTSTPTPISPPTSSPTPTITPIPTPACPSCPLSQSGTPVSRPSPPNTYNINLSWSDVNSEDGYKIYRCQGSACSKPSTALTTLGANTTSYTDTNSNNGFTCGTTWSYWIVPIKTGCTEPSCTRLVVNLPACSTPTPSPTPTPTSIPPRYLTLEFNLGTVEREVQYYYQNSWFFGGNQYIKIPQGYSGTITKVAVQINYYGDNNLTALLTEKTPTSINYNPQEKTINIYGTNTFQWVEFDFNYPIKEGKEYYLWVKKNNRNNKVYWLTYPGQNTPTTTIKNYRLTILSSGENFPSPTPTPIPTPIQECPKINKISAGKIAENNCWIYLSWSPVPNAQKYKVVRNNSIYKETPYLSYTWTALPCGNNSLYKVIPIKENETPADCPGVSIITPK